MLVGKSKHTGPMLDDGFVGVEKNLSAHSRVFSKFSFPMVLSLRFKYFSNSRRLGRSSHLSATRNMCDISQSMSCISIVG